MEKEYWQIFDRRMDITFISLMSVVALAHLYCQVKSYKTREMRNTVNIIENTFTFLCLVLHICCMSYSTLKDGNRAFNQLTIQNYFTFQCCFDLLNIAILAKSQQWLEFSYTLNMTVQLMRRQEEKENSDSINARRVSRN